jgi:hypothetical protein
VRVVRDAGEMEERVGGVADGNESSSGEGHGRQEVMMGGWWAVQRWRETDAC